MAVARAMQTFASIPNLPRSDWLDASFLSGLYENLILEERTDIRTVSFQAFEAALNEMILGTGNLQEEVETLIQDWYSLVMIPVGAEMHPSYFASARKSITGHDVDKSMMAGDMTILSPELVIQTRIAGAMALAKLRLLYTGQGVSHSDPAERALILSRTDTIER
jgi:TATA-binding protein-associated factor